jgi:hypothetical protein
MSEPNAEPMDFDKAQFEQADGAALSCALCQEPLTGTYYSLNGHGVCEACLAQRRAGQKGSFFAALGLGVGAGVVGAAVYYGIRKLTGYDLALITIGLGILVGLAVRRGAGQKQSVLYRLMSVALAWIAMAITYAPSIAEDMQGGDDSGLSGLALWIAAAILSMTVPFFLISGMEVIALLIFGFGLWEAWRLSAPPPFIVEGPFTAAPAPAAIAGEVVEAPAPPPA